jgi:D-lactate dehydrogenase
LGLVGGGRIGMNVASIAKAMGMSVIVADPNPRLELAQEHGFTYADLERMLPQADVVSLHVPYLPATHHMMNDKNFGLMKRGAILVNTSRGGLIDTGALLRALESGKLSGAGLDVIEEECCFREEAELAAGKYREQCDLQALVRNHALISRNDVIITPHIAWYSDEAVMRILETTVENIEKFIGGEPVNSVETK